MTNLAISHRRSLFFLLVLTGISFFSFSLPANEGIPFKGFSRTFQISCIDTVPQKKKSKIKTTEEQSPSKGISINRSIENAMREVERSMQRLKAELRNNSLNESAHFYKRNMDNVYWKETVKATKRALVEAQARVNYIDLSKTSALERQLQLADINKTTGFKQLALERNRKNLELAMKYDRDYGTHNAKLALRAANGRLKKIDDFKNDLFNDGLIKKEEPYTIEIKEGKLYINDKKQPAKVYKKYEEKYGEYFEKKNYFKIKNSRNEKPRFEEGELI